MRVCCASRRMFIYLFIFSPSLPAVYRAPVDGSPITSLTIARDGRRFNIPFAPAARHGLQRFCYPYGDVNDSSIAHAHARETVRCIY